MVANGFTLFELLVALAVFGCLLVALAQGTQFGLLAWARNMRLTSGNSDLDTADTTVRHLIEGMEPGDGLEPAPMSGNGNRLNCVTALPHASGAMAIGSMRAELLVDAEHRLVLRWRPHLHATLLTPLPTPTDTELLRGISRIVVSYWRPDDGWVRVWHDPNLPTLVRVQLQFPAYDTRRWPDIVAAPRLNRE
jgi:prepilin-type N-terminal cleavage/methylation domain-containing protein